MHKVKDNAMQTAHKFQVIFMGLEKGQKLSFEINGISIRTTEEVEPLGITIDSKLQFQSHVEAICKAANKKVKAFYRIAGHLQKAQSICAVQDFYKVNFQLLSTDMDVLW